MRAKTAYVNMNKYYIIELLLNCLHLNKQKKTKMKRFVIKDCN